MASSPKKKKRYNYRDPREEFVRRLAGGIWSWTGANAYDTEKGRKEGVKNGYRPAIVDSVASLPALASALYGLARGRKDAFEKPIEGDSAVANALNAAWRGSERAQLRAREQVGVDAPSNTFELATEIIPSMLAGGPKPSTIARVGRAVGAAAPGVARAAQPVIKAGKAVADAYGVIPQAIRTPINKVAPWIAEAALPLRQTPLKYALPIGTAATAAIDVLMDQSVDPSTGKRYQGIPNKLGIKFAEAGKEEAPQSEEDMALDDQLDTLALGSAIETGAVDPEQAVGLLQHQQPTEEDMVVADHSEGLSRGELAVGAIATILGGTYATKYANRVVRNRRAASVNPENFGNFGDRPPPPPPGPGGQALPQPKFTGKAYKGSELSAKDRMITGTFDQSHPLRVNADRHLGRARGEQYGDEADAMLNSSIQSKIKHFATTGEIPDSTMQTEPLFPWLEALAKDLTLTQQRELDDALVAASALDDWRRTGNKTSLGTDQAGNPVSQRQLEQLVWKVKTDPVQGQYFNQMQKWHDDLEKFRVKGELQTDAEYQKIRRERPNYAPHIRNVEKDTSYSPFSQTYSANQQVTRGATRSTETAGGIQGNKGVGSPTAAIAEDWADAIRTVQQNKYRARYLQEMAASRGTMQDGSRVVVPVNPTRVGEDDVHEVFIRGKQYAFKVNDPILSQALHFAPREVVQVAETIKNLTQEMTTGKVGTAFNLWQFVRGPFQEAMGAATFAGKHTKVGALNRAFVGGPIGAMRSAIDEFHRNTGIRLRSNVIRSNSLMKKMMTQIDPQAMNHLAKFFEDNFKRSNTAMLDKIGASSHAGWGASDPSHTLKGIELNTPNFTNAIARHQIEDIKRAVRGDPANGIKPTLSAARGAMKAIPSVWLATKTMPILRQMTLAIEAANNGVKHTALSANKNARGSRNMAKLVSDLRRMGGGDPAKHGSNKAVNSASSLFDYLPISLQNLYEIGRRGRESPTTFAANIARTSMSVAAIYYLSMYYDKDADAIDKMKTPEQKATGVTVFGGGDLPVDQANRVVLAQLLPFLDHISGRSRGDGKMDPNFIRAMKNFIEGETPKMTEEEWSAWERQTNAGLDAITPMSPMRVGVTTGPEGPTGLTYRGDAGGIPLARGFQAGAGMDVSANRLTGDVGPPRDQQISGIEDDDRMKPGSLFTASVENFLRNVGGAATMSIVSMADDVYRAMEGGADQKEILDIMFDAWAEKAQQGAGPAKALFNRTQRRQAGSVTAQLVAGREEGIDKAIKAYQTNFERAGATSSDPYTQQPIESNDPAYRDIGGTEAEHIGALAEYLKAQIKQRKDILDDYSKKIALTNAERKWTQSQKNKRINELNKERIYQNLWIMWDVREYEQRISDDLGRPFIFKGYKPTEYLTPYKGRQQPVTPQE